jgi:hypothetical protein
MGRKFLGGLDTPVSRPLSSYSQPELALRKQAVEHEQHRLESVAETLALVGLMTVKKVLSGNEVVAVKGEAVYQLVSGVKKHGTVGAHCLPGKLNFNGAHLHIRAEWKPEEIKQKGMKPLPLSSKLRHLFGRVDVLDGSINDADTWVEKMSKERGLKFHFGRAVERLMKNILVRKPATVRTLGELIEEAHGHYTFGANYIYEERLDSLAHPLPSGQTDKNNATRKLIIEQYWAALQDPNFVPEAIGPLGFRDVIRDVLAEGPDMISKGADAFQV